MTIRPQQRVAEAVGEFLQDDGAQPPSGPLIWLPIGPIQVPFPNPGRLRQHDLHHLALGVRPTFKGEIVVSSLELWNRPPSWTITVLCLGAIGLGMLRWPIRTTRVLRRVRGMRVVYGLDVAPLHAGSVAELRARLRIPEAGLDDAFWCEP
jgi:hypothetical protein